MARYDIPAFINYILRQTMRSSITYIGHSMGCLVFFASLSLFPEYCANIKKMIALAPAVYGRHISNIYLKVGTILAHGVSRVKPMYARQVPLDRRTTSNHVSLLCPPFNYLVGADKVGALLLSTVGVQFGMFGREQVEPVSYMTSDLLAYLRHNS